MSKNRVPDAIFTYVMVDYRYVVALLPDCAHLHIFFRKNADIFGKLILYSGTGTYF